MDLSKLDSVWSRCLLQEILLVNMFWQEKLTAITHAKKKRAEQRRSGGGEIDGITKKKYNNLQPQSYQSVMRSIHLPADGMSAE